MLADIQVDVPLTIGQVLAKVETLGTLPEVTARIITTVDDPKSTAADLNRIVSHDPTLVARILKMVNSSFYGHATQINSVERAIVMLGFDAINNMAIATSMGQLFRGPLCSGFAAKDLWSHCIAVGVVAREMAKLFNQAIAEEAFLTGLVHDLGILAFLQAEPQRLRTTCDAARTTEEPLRRVEKRLMGIDHQEMGSALAKQWKFPTSCRAAAAHHHDPLSAPESCRQIVAVVHAADILCCRARVGFNLTAIKEDLEDSILKGLVPFSALKQTGQQLGSIVWTALTIFG